MSEIAFVNNGNHAKEGYVINPLISFKSWNEYLQFKDLDMSYLCSLM